MSIQDAELVARIAEARKVAAAGANLARLAGENMDETGSERTQMVALTSIALSLSALTTVLLATVDDEASR